MIGWSLGLVLGSMSLSWLGGFLGLISGGSIAGLMAGGAQYIANPHLSRRWLWLSMTGGAFGALAAFLFLFSLIAGQIVALLVWGAAFGGMFGRMQALMLRDRSDDFAVWWIAANILAGGVCALFSPFNTGIALPVFCTPGPLLFGLITGYALRRFYAHVY